jgi:inosine-uridine nucleoside N-ribohydrolase
MKNKIPIIIDCDPGIDDAMAIAMLQKSNLFDIKAITTVAGNSTVKNTTNNAFYISNALRINGPIYSGASKPLRKKLVMANVQGENGFGNIRVAIKIKLTNNACLKIAGILETFPYKITILAIGPLTNIANLITFKPKTAEKIKEIIIMGGAINVKGNKSKLAEFNFFVDPDAAKIVLESNIKKVLIPLDVCNKTSLDLQKFKKVKYQFLYSLAQSYQEGLKKYDNTEKIIAYDAVAAYFLINPRAFSCKYLRLTTETANPKRFGTVIKTKSGKTTRVATNIDAVLFEKDFFKILKGGDKYV